MDTTWRKLHVPERAWQIANVTQETNLICEVLPKVLVPIDVGETYILAVALNSQR